MPKYDFQCPSCGSTTEVHLPSWRDRNTAKIGCLDCHAEMKRLFPVEAARGIRGDFTPYYDEGLGCNIYSKAERNRILREMNLVEAGDPVKGARLYDPKAPHQVGKLPLVPGADYKSRNKQDAVIEVEDKGKWEPVRLSELPSLPEPNLQKAEEAFKLIPEVI